MRNCSLEFLREILGGKRKYFLLHEIASVHVPVCPELTVKRIFVRLYWILVNNNGAFGV